MRTENKKKKKLKISVPVIAIFMIVLFQITGVTASDNSCIDCHKTLAPFLEVQKQFNQIRIQHLERDINCSLECHEDRVRQLTTSNYQQWSESVHGLKGITCEICHEGDPKQATKEKAHLNIKKPTDPESPVYYTNVPKTCGKCHSKELSNFENSKHYQKLEALKTAPTCTTCHAPHTFKVMNTEDFRNFCGKCHSVYSKVAPYDIPVQAGYLLGKANKLKFNIDTTGQDIFWAKKNGTDVAMAEKYVEDVLKVFEGLAPMWHEFNLTHFETSLDDANRELKKAGDVMKPAPKKTSTSSIPGFAGIIAILSFLGVFYLIKKK